MDYDVLSPVLNPMIAMEIMESPSSIGTAANSETKTKRRKRRISSSASTVNDQGKKTVITFIISYTIRETRRNFAMRESRSSNRGEKLTEINAKCTEIPNVILK